MNWQELKEVASWGQHLLLAQLNADRWMCLEENTAAESVALTFQFFASMFVVIEGWKKLKLRDQKIEEILDQNREGVDLLRRARNAVYHFQKEMYGRKITDFADEMGRSRWLITLYREFVRFLAEYPTRVYPFDSGEQQFCDKFYELLGWVPDYERT